MINDEDKKYYGTDYSTQAMLMEEEIKRYLAHLNSEQLKLTLEIGEIQKNLKKDSSNEKLKQELLSNQQYLNSVVNNDKLSYEILTKVVELKNMKPPYQVPPKVLYDQIMSNPLLQNIVTSENFGNIGVNMFENGDRLGSGDGFLDSIVSRYIREEYPNYYMEDGTINPSFQMIEMYDDFGLTEGFGSLENIRKLQMAMVKSMRDSGKISNKDYLRCYTAYQAYTVQQNQLQSQNNAIRTELPNQNSVNDEEKKIDVSLNTQLNVKQEQQINTSQSLESEDRKYYGTDYSTQAMLMKEEIYSYITKLNQYKLSAMKEMKKIAEQLKQKNSASDSHLLNLDLQAYQRDLDVYERNDVEIHNVLDMVNQLDGENLPENVPPKVLYDKIMDIPIMQNLAVSANFGDIGANMFQFEGPVSDIVKSYIKDNYSPKTKEFADICDESGIGLDEDGTYFYDNRWISLDNVYDVLAETKNAKLNSDEKLSIIREMRDDGMISNKDYLRYYVANEAHKRQQLAYAMLRQPVVEETNENDIGGMSSSR